MDPINVFDDIAAIIRQDYAGAEEVQYPDAHLSFLRYCAQLNDQHRLEDETLYQFIQLYLQVIGDKKLSFDIKEYAGFHHFQRGFSLRSDGQEVWIDSVQQEERLKPGDRVVQLNQYSPAAFRTATSLFRWEQPLNERDDWKAYLDFARTISVEKADGQVEKVILKKYEPLPVEPKIECFKADGQTTVLRIDNFLEEDKIARILSDHYVALTSCKRLIIDLRRNGGGYFSAMQTLLPFVIDRNLNAGDFFQSEELYTRYSKRNCDLFIATMEPFVRDPDFAEIANAEIAEYQSRKGQSWLPAVMDASSDKGEAIKSCRSAEKVIMLTDTSSKDEAEIFCLAAREIAGIQLVGRATGGTFEYSNPVTMDYGYGMTFTYPISKTKRCMDGNGYQQRGIPVDVQIPWSKAEIGSDVILNTAIQL